VFQKLAWIALAGILGTLARYGLGGLVQNLTDRIFPWGTVTINLLGCFAFGIVWSALEGRWPTSGETRTIILVGFMGAFTTFSTYIFEFEEMLHDAEWLPALGYFAIHNVGGVVAMIAGLALGRFI